MWIKFSWFESIKYISLAVIWHQIKLSVETVRKSKDSKDTVIMFRPWDKVPSRQHQGGCVHMEGKGPKGETELMLVVLTPSKVHNIKSVHNDSQKVNQFAKPPHGSDSPSIRKKNGNQAAQSSSM